MTNKNQVDKASTYPMFPPVVTVLGHVDHGKTTLLDAIRKTTIAQREHGGITQRIGASSIEILREGVKRNITFIDTPGHEAFARMRSRGAKAADIGLLVVSSVDGVMPQTRESIQLLSGAQLPFIVVLTKADVPDKNIEKVKQQLLKENVLLEGYGGSVPVIEVSARTGHNIQGLLDLILLVYELIIEEKKDHRLSQNPLHATVIESKLDPKVGPRATVVVKDGSITLRDELLCEGVSARVRTLIDTEGKQVKQAGVGQAVEILGFEGVPQVGSIVVRKNEQAIIKQEAVPTVSKKAAPMFHDESTLSVILCADTLGSLEAITQGLPEEIILTTQKTGDITSADILLAKSIGAIVVGFNIVIKPDVMHLARTEKILLKNYTIIYELLDELQDAMEGKMLSMQEQVFGKAQVLASFPFEKTQVLGVRVLEGRVAKGDRARLVRGETVVGESIITSLRQGKNATSKIEKGAEGGIIISPLIDFTIGDMVICHD